MIDSVVGFQINEVNKRYSLHYQYLLHQQGITSNSNIQDMTTSIPIINPQKSGTSDGKSQGFIKHHQLIFPPKSTTTKRSGSLPLLNPPIFFRASSSQIPTLTTPFTIFFNGMVSVFNLPHDKAEMILKLAEEGRSRVVESVDMNKLPASSLSSNPPNFLHKLNRDLPLARKKSLHRFLEKRKQRLITMAKPYQNGKLECGLGKNHED